MSTQKMVLQNCLQDEGWEVEVIGNDDADLYALGWWADEAWRLTSVWSPRGVVVYVVFMINPMVNIHKRKQGEGVWEARASSYLPMQQPQEGDVCLDLTAGWQDRLHRFISELSELRGSAKF